MNLGRVIGTVWASQKHDGFAGLKMQLIQPLSGDGTRAGGTRVACDSVGAGPGELVFTVDQYEATLAFPALKNVPIDCAIVGIVDELNDQSAEVLASDDRGGAGL
ncbi:MAG: EutN/CcmL family microcompartment protein [Planctomycetes bacterium]|nr:EutN/CcmL family microcompartment protein [Planctomycetota bacterium]